MKILVIEDDEFDYLLLCRNLERAFCDAPIEVEWISDPRVEDLVETIDTFDVCFVDHGLPTLSGTELIGAMTQAGTQTPMILLTGDARAELDQMALAAGASDFLHKDQISVSSVLRSTRHCITRKDQERRLREMAYTDPLTGLANRAAFDEKCKAGLARVASSGRQLILLLLDLDGFKKINDHYGHHHGDQLLQQFAGDLKSKANECSLVARLGGDEFAVLLEPDSPMDPDQARVDLRRSLKSTFDLVDITVSMKASIGVFSVDALDSDMSETSLLQRADRNLYADKRCRKFMERQSLDADAIDGFDLEKTVSALEKAILADELDVFYQPKVNFRSGKIMGLEALVRWTGSNNTLGPDIFIPIAEEYGLINEIGTMVLRHVCLQIKIWEQQQKDVPPVSINVSPLQLENDLFYQTVAQTFEDFDVTPNKIEFELTEGYFSNNLDGRIDQMTRIASLGCNWSIDDFGIGYSSLSRLHTLPISKIKIDKSFLSQLPGNQDATDISNTIILMARKLHLDVVVEGVETLNQLSDLNLADTDELQGYLYFRPMEAADIECLLTAEKTAAA